MPSYLAIPGIPGDSVAERHEGAIEVPAWGFGCSLATGTFGTGTRANRPDLSELTLSCRSGSARPGCWTPAPWAGWPPRRSSPGNRRSDAPG